MQATKKKGHTLAAPGPSPLPARESWRTTFIIAVAIWAVAMGFGSIVMVGDEGFGTLVSAVYWEVSGFVFVVMLIIGIALRYGLTTTGDVERRREARRRRRAGRPRDHVLLGSSSAEERREWHRRVRAAARRRVILRAVLAVPLSLVVLAAVSAELAALLPDAVGVVVAVIGAVCLWGVLVADARRQWGDPLLLVARITGGVDGVAMSAGDMPSTKGAILGWFEKGHWRSITIDVSSASRLHCDGALKPCAHWRGCHEVGVPGRVLRRMIQGERCVLLCSGAGPVVNLLGSLVHSGRLRRARPTR